MKSDGIDADVGDLGRSPYGERGLKLKEEAMKASEQRRSPYGERGLKFEALGHGLELGGRSPYGERGLKFGGELARACGLRSLSLRRAWIEIRQRSTTR